MVIDRTNNPPRLALFRSAPLSLKPSVHSTLPSLDDTRLRYVYVCSLFNNTFCLMQNAAVLQLLGVSYPGCACYDSAP